MGRITNWSNILGVRSFVGAGKLLFCLVSIKEMSSMYGVESWQLEPFAFELNSTTSTTYGLSVQKS